MEPHGTADNLSLWVKKSEEHSQLGVPVEEKDSGHEERPFRGGSRRKAILMITKQAEAECMGGR